VYVDLDDINDNPPKFTLALYKRTILETMPVQISIVQLSANDLDIGNNGVVAYMKVSNSGDPDGKLLWFLYLNISNNLKLPKCIALQTPVDFESKKLNTCG